MRYEPRIDVDAVEAIDVHVHIEVGDDGTVPLPRDLVEAADRYFGGRRGPRLLDEIATFYREQRIAAVVFTVDATTALGTPPNSSAEIAEGAARNADVLIPFGSVDPHQAGAIDAARRLVEEHGVRGFKFHPSLQAFDPSDERFFPLWEAIAELRVPALIHSGQTGIGAGLPGGRGIKLRYSNPMLVDDVAAEFPTLDIILAHPSVPWQDEAISIATHKGNVAIDLSGWSPKYFPPQLVRAANSFLQDKVLFGSDFPMLTPDRWMRDFAGLELKDEVRPKVLRDNAIRVLGLNNKEKS